MFDDLRVTSPRFSPRLSAGRTLGPPAIPSAGGLFKLPANQ